MFAACFCACKHLNHGTRCLVALGSHPAAMPRLGSHPTAIPRPARLWVLQLQDDKRVLVPASSLLLVDFELRQRAEVRAAAARELLPAELLVGGGSQAG